MTTQEIEAAKTEWAEHYTWTQPDGSLDYSCPRLRTTSDGTAPPSELCNPGAQKVAEGDT